MKPIDELSLDEAKAIKVAYKTKFSNYSLDVSKMASRLGAGREFLSNVRDAVESGVPMDFDAFGTKLFASLKQAETAPA